MNKEELLVHLEYCFLDTEIVVRIDGKDVPISDIQHRSTNKKLVLILAEE